MKSFINLSLFEDFWEDLPERKHRLTVFGINYIIHILVD